MELTSGLLDIHDLFNKISNELVRPKILVVGDVMLDRYWFGEVNRISPEAPVPIAKIHTTEHRAGGAANVAVNVAKLGGDVTLLAAVGADDVSKVLMELLAQDNVETIFYKDASIKTALKLRVMARNQQLIRVDFEESPSSYTTAETLNAFSSIINTYDLVIFSDYGKGGLNQIDEMIKLANAHNKITLVDPKGTDYARYANATMITPNKHELQQVIGSWKNEQELEDKVRDLLHELHLRALLLTKSEEGMSLYLNTDSGNAYHYMTCAKEVYDVSGAGDTVIATLGLMLAHGVSLQQATMIANIAAGIVVGKLGTAAITMQELRKEIKGDMV